MKLSSNDIRLSSNNKSKHSYGSTCCAHGQVIRYKDGCVSSVSNSRLMYQVKHNNKDTFDMVLDKTTHPVWSVIKNLLRK